MEWVLTQQNYNFVVTNILNAVCWSQAVIPEMAERESLNRLWSSGFQE